MVNGIGRYAAGEAQVSEVATEREQLDANYNLRARVPHFQDHFDAYVALSQAFRSEWPHQRRHLGYGTSERQAIDLFLPGAAAAAPLHVFIHGGYWQSQARENFAFVARPFVERGIAVALIGYDLAPTVTVTTIAGQVRSALAWLHANGARHGVDPGRLVISGHSAGGHLAALALATDWRARGLPADLVKGVCAISGLFDLEPVRRCYLNDVLKMDAAEAAALSPIHMETPGTAPVLLTVGGAETEAFLEQSRGYAGHLENQGRDVRLEVQPGLDHFEIVRALARPDNPACRWILDLLARA